MCQVFITGYRLVEAPYTKPYHVYVIQVVLPSASVKHVLEKRYSEFNTLHRMLKKDSDASSFPPKKVRNSNPKVLEQRRAALEVYLQKMLKLSTTKQQVLQFLGIDSEASVTSKRIHGEVGTSTMVDHYPILTFQYDPYIRANVSSSLPDIVTNGVLVGVYKS